MNTTRATVAIIAGTPEDTRMGAALVESHGYSVIPFATASSPQEQKRMQFFEPKKLQSMCLQILCDAEKSGARAGLIYCNSLSCTLDLDKLRAESPISVLTPIEAHVQILSEYDHIGLITANGQSLSGLEKVLLQNYPNMHITAATLPKIVLGIEAGVSPDQLVFKQGLIELCTAFQKMGAQCIVLGCTHFPYFADCLAQAVELPVVNPDDVMIKLLKQTLESDS